jgi:hypothetical protein
VLSHVGEGSVAVVFVEPVIGVIRRMIETRATQDEDIQPAVIIVIDKGHAAAHSFDDVILAGNAAVDHRCTQAGLLGDIHEAGSPGQSRGLTARERLHTTAGDALRHQT